MNNVIQKFLLAGDKLMVKIHLRHPGFQDLGIVLEDQLQKSKKEYKNSKKQETRDISIKTNWKRPVFHSLWLRMRSKIYPKQLLTEHYVEKHLQLLVIQRMMNISVDTLLWSTKFFTTNLEILLPTKKQE